MAELSGAEATAAHEVLARPLAWRRGRLRGLALPGFEEFDPLALPWEAVAAKEPLPQGFEPAKRSRSRLVIATEVRGERLFVKRAMARTWRHRISALVQGSKLRREWHTARRFLAAGVNVPVPIFLAEAPRWTSYLATRAFPQEWESLDVRFAREGIDDATLEELARYTRWLHALPAYHDDYRTEHIHRTDAPGDAPPQEQFALLDLDGAHAGAAPSRAKREEALSELFLSLMRDGLTRDQVERFVALYDKGKAEKFDAEALFKRALQQHEENRRGR